MANFMLINKCIYMYVVTLEERKWLIQYCRNLSSLGCELKRAHKELKNF